jgi:glutamate carboxypeptidase
MDIKGGTVMMWLVLNALGQQAPEVYDEVTWKLFWNAAEEPLAPDFAGVWRSRLDERTLAALVFEAEDRRGDEILLVTGRKGRGAWRATATGRGAHAGSKHALGANAIVQLSQTVEGVAALTDYSRQLTFNVGCIRGGTVANRVPHEATAEGEYRAFAPEVCAQARQALLALAGPGAVRSPQDGYACEVKIEILREWRPWPPNPGTEALCGIWGEAGAELGLRVSGEARGGLSDANGLWEAVPTLDGLGPWGDNEHCSERSADGSKLPEFVVVSSFAPKAAVNVAAIARLVESSA